MILTKADELASPAPNSFLTGGEQFMPISEANVASKIQLLMEEFIQT